MYTYHYLNMKEGRLVHNLSLFYFDNLIILNLFFPACLFLSSSLSFSLLKYINSCVVCIDVMLVNVFMYEWIYYAWKCMQLQWTHIFSTKVYMIRLRICIKWINEKIYILNRWKQYINHTRVQMKFTFYISFKVIVVVVVGSR